VLTDIFTRFGPDSTLGKIASVMCGSGETTFYSVTVYYGAVGVQNSRHTIPVALLADFLVAVLSGIGVRMLL
jgi:spore maturation protein B